MDTNHANLDALRAAYYAAVENARINPSPEAREATKAAWAAYDAAAPRVKSCWSGYSSRAGKRQAAERRALQSRRNR